MKLLLPFFIALLLFANLGCNQPKSSSSENLSSFSRTQAIKQQLDTAEMKEYVIKEFGYKVVCPAFFHADTTESQSVRLSYDDDSTFLRMTLIVEPNTEQRSLDDMINNFTLGDTQCQ